MGEMSDLIDDIVFENLSQPTKLNQPFPWAGSKWNLAPWIVEYIPTNFRIYVEPFCGSAAVFWHLKRPFEIEVLNDLDGLITNFFRVMQDEGKFTKFFHKILWTPFSREEFKRSIDILSNKENHNDIDLAWAFFINLTQGFSGIFTLNKSWLHRWGSAIKGRMGENVIKTRWHHKIYQLRFLHKRLFNVRIESLDALELIKHWDTKETVFYLDPPYITDTRVSKDIYNIEANKGFHRELVNLLLEIKGAAILSGYKHELYNPLEENGWKRVDKEVYTCMSSASGEKGETRNKRTESLWISPNCGEGQQKLF